jgi:benzoate membrane transport protein
MQFFKDISLSAFTAGFVAVLVGFTSSVAIVFQAAQALHATPEMIASWMWALGLGMGLCIVLPSLWLKKPVMVAWSTPGAAVLATAGATGGFSIHEAVGAFMVCAALITLSGATGWFERVMNRIPLALASALLAGVLARFGLAGFAAAQTALPLVVCMLLAYLLCKRWWPRYAVPFALLVAIVFVAITVGFTRADIAFGLTIPVLVRPDFTLAALVSLALPLFIVTMASQNLPGVAAIQSTGYGDQRANGGDGGIPISKVITLTGLATLVLAPFGALCAEPECHHRRHLHGPRSARRPQAALHSRRVLWFLLRADWPVWRGHHGPADGIPQRAGGGHRGAGAAGHHWQRTGRCGAGRTAPRGGHHHLSGHAQRASRLRG